jgi:hypothetical protein
MSQKRSSAVIRSPRRRAKKVEMAERGHVTADGEPCCERCPADAGIIDLIF